jgi:hypothetical protein
MEKERDTVSWSIEKTEYMKVNGAMITEKVKEWNVTQMETSTRETSRKAKPAVEEYIIGPTVKFTMANGKQESKKGTECGEAFSETLI